MARVIPVLGSAGFAVDMTIKADEAMSNFYICQRSQSDMYRGNIASLGDIISRLGNNSVDLPTEVQRVLSAYLGRQFSSVDLDVKANVQGSSIDLRITAILRDGKRSVDIAHVVSASDSKIRSIVDLQNNGKPIYLADS